MLVMLNDWRRRSNADDDLRKCGRRSETESEQPCKIVFFTGILNLRGLDLPESGSLFLATNSINPMDGHSSRIVEKSGSPTTPFN